MEQQNNDLTSAQYDAVKNDANRLRILAGAGSGKTRVLTHRIAHQSKAFRLEPEHALCLTFTKKAAEELQARLQTLGLSSPVAAGTFHALAYSQLQTRWKDLDLPRPPSVLENRKRILVPMLPKQLSFDVRESTMNEINWATARRLNPEAYPAAAEAARRKPAVGMNQISEFLLQFAQEKKRLNLIDFDDILEYAINDLTNDPEYAAGRHWKYRYIFVDEFQDVNPLQFALLRAWLGPDSSICVVGDPDQAIYSWNGADAKYLKNFDTYFPGSSTVELNENFRSTPQIIELASSLLKKEVKASKAQKPDGEIPSIYQAKTCSQEAEHIAKRINETGQISERLSRQAVLVRTHAQISQIIETFSRFSIPCSSPLSRETPLGTEDANTNNESVTVTTFHASKGLEWPIVYIAGLEEGFSPISYADSDAALDEERRLLYVAMTRAKEQLHCTWARQRTFGNRKVTRNASPYLREISHSMDKTNFQMESGVPLRNRIQMFRNQIFPKTNPQETNPQLKKNLHIWRERRAIAADVKPQNVISDQALEQLIATKPQTKEQLEQIADMNTFSISRYGEEILKILSNENT